MTFRNGLMLTIFVSIPFLLRAATINDSTKSAFGTWEKLSIEGGAFVTNSTSNFRFGSDQLGLGVDINLEQALGLDVNSFTGRAQLLYRFTPNLRHGFRAGYYQLSRTATKSFEKEFKIGRSIYKTGSIVETKLSFSVLKFEYGYSFFMDDRVNLSLSAGVFMVPTTFSIKSQDSKAEETNFTAPLPIIGFQTDFKITPKISVQHSASVFYLKLNSLEGTMLDMSINMQYQILDHLALGMGYNGFDFDFLVHTGGGVFGEGVVEVGYNYAGLLLFGKFMF